MDKTSKEHLANDIENRLDDFFDESDATSSAEAPSVSLERLKSVVLSIDWEITNACLDDLEAEIENLLPQFQHDRLVHALLRMLKALGRYIRNLKAQAHPNAINRIMSAYNSLEKLVSNGEVDDDSRKRILAKEIADFKDLKQQVESKRGGPATSKPVSDPDAASFVEHQKFEKAMSDVEKRLNEQVELLKSQLENVQQEIDSLRKS